MVSLRRGNLGSWKKCVYLEVEKPEHENSKTIIDMKKLFSILACAVFGLASAFAQNTYTKITTADELVEDGVYLIATSEYGMALGMNFGNNAAREKAAVTISNGVISTEVAAAATDKLPYEIVLKKNGSNWSLFDVVNQKYIARTTVDENKIQNQDEAYEWKITIDADGNADIASLETTARRILYNANSGQERFNAYKAVNNTNKVVQLYKKGGTFVDETAPEVDKILSKSYAPTTLEVYFNEAVTKASAEAVANYTIEGITISAAVLDAAGKKVTLTTTAMTPGTEYTLAIKDVEDNSGNKTNISEKFFFGYKKVADLAALNALRGTAVVGQKYCVEGEVVITAIVGKNGTAANVTNAWVQDKGCATAKGHSMMLYYVNNLIPSTAKVGDVLKNVTAEVVVYNDLIEMQYFDTVAIQHTVANETVKIDEVKIADILGADKVQYQNAMVRIKGVDFDKPGEAFAAKTTYKIADDANTIDFRTQNDGTYIGQTIPSAKADVVVFVGCYKSTYQVSPRMKEDITLSGDPQANEEAEAIRFAAYPNPTTGVLNVEAEGSFNVVVYNMAGVQLMRAAGNEQLQLNLSALAKGMYVVEIRTAEGRAYTKVVRK